MSNRRTARRAAGGVSRRQFLGRGGVVLGGLAFGPALLAACGDDDSGSSGGDDDGGGGGGRSLAVSNWPLYLDDESEGLFEDQTGIDLTYTEDINDNNELFAKIQEPLARGQSIGADIIAPTTWMVARMISLGYVKQIDFTKIPNAVNLSPRLQNPSWDPEGLFSLPWQTGMTGIAYNVSAAGRELTSIDDLFDPEYSGKIGMLLEMRDSLGLVLLGEGVDPATVTFDQAGGAFDKIQEATDSGQIRKFTGNDYQDDLVNGDFIACVAWSGDVAQLSLDDPNIRFVIPDAGGMQWADIMVIVEPSEHVAEAEEWMNFAYDPVNAARIAEFVQFISPVDGIQDELRTLDPEAADNPLIFPPPETLAELSEFAVLDDDQEAQFDERWSEITAG